MTYPPNSGYPPSQQPTTQFSAPTQGFGKIEQSAGPTQAPAATPAAAGPSKLPFFLLAGVAVLGILVYLFSFGDVFTIESTDFPQMGSASGTSQGVVMAVVAALVAGLIAAASLLPKQRAPIGVIAAIAVLSFLLTLAEIIQKPEGVSIGWALYALIVLTFLQSAVSVGALLFDAGIVKAPVPKPKHEQQPNYGPYGQPSQYYGQHAPHQGAGQQRPQYPGQGQGQGQGQYGGYSGGSSAGGGFAPIGQQGGPPTPPTGFPTYSQPQASQSAPSGQSQPQSSGSSSSSSNQSGNSSS